jgi:hypothetical protein
MFRLALLLPALLLAAVIAAGPASAGPARPTLAVEDTMRTQVPEVLVRAPRVTLDEILERVARGEKRRDSLMTDQTFLITARAVRNAQKGKPPELLTEVVTRVYRKRPDHVRTDVLRHYDAEPEKKRGAQVRVSARAGMDEEIVNFAFRPEAHRDYRYRILGRDLVGDHVVYRIAFEPRSLLDATQPRGTVWIDTNDFVIVRQELGFDRTPGAPFLKDVSRIVIERQNVDGFWVLKRILMRAEATFALPRVGKSFDLSILYDQYAINRGLPDSLFVQGKEKR